MRSTRVKHLNKGIFMQMLLHENLYIDTNIFIAAIEDFNRQALSLFQWAEKGKVFLVTSEISRSEALVKPLQYKDEKLVIRYDALFSRQGMEVLPIEEDIARKAADFSASLGLELPDAIHLATAELSSCAYIISQDRDLRHYSPIECLSLEELELEEKEAG